MHIIHIYLILVLIAHIPIWGTYDEWKAKVPLYEQYRRNTRLPLKKSSSIFKDIILPQVIGAILASVVVQRLLGSKSVSVSSGGTGQIDAVESAISELIKLATKSGQKFGESSLPSLSQIEEETHRVHQANLDKARIAAEHAAELERRKKYADHTRGSVQLTGGGRRQPLHSYSYVSGFEKEAETPTPVPQIPVETIGHPKPEKLRAKPPTTGEEHAPGLRPPTFRGAVGIERAPGVHKPGWRPQEDGVNSLHEWSSKEKVKRARAAQMAYLTRMRRRGT